MERDNMQICDNIAEKESTKHSAASITVKNLWLNSKNVSTNACERKFSIHFLSYIEFSPEGTIFQYVKQ